MGLEAHDIIDGALSVVPAELDHRKGLPPRPGVLQAHRLQRAVTQGVPPPAGHYLHRHAPLKDAGVLKAVDLRLLGGGEGLPEGLVLLLLHGTVDVIRCPPVVPGGKPGPLHIHALKGDQGGRRVEEIQVAAVREQAGDLLRQGVGGQRAGGDDDLPLLRNALHLPLHHRDGGVGADGLGHCL